MRSVMGALFTASRYELLPERRIRDSSKENGTRLSAQCFGVIEIFTIESFRMM